MGTIYVARSTNLSHWGSDVGLSKHIYKIGYSDGALKEAIAAGWAGETDWKIVKSEPVEGLSEEEALDRLGRKEPIIDPTLYPKLKGATGVFRVAPTRVENHIIVSRALAGDSDRVDLRLKPADFAAYLIHNARR